jgi:hypothetical protein
VLRVAAGVVAACMILLPTFWMSSGDRLGWRIALLIACCVGLAFSAAMSAFSSATDPRALAGLREQLAGAGTGGTPPKRLLRNWIGARFVNSLAAPFMTLLLLSPVLYLCTRCAITGPNAPAYDPLLGIATMTFAAANLMLGGAVGLLAATRPANGTRLNAVVSLAGSQVMLAILGFAAIVFPLALTDNLGLGLALFLGFGIGAILALTVAFPYRFHAAANLAERLRLPDGEGVECDPADGDMCFWDLFAWKFWRDPMVRAERRNLWTLKRFVLAWALLLPFLLLPSLPWTRTPLGSFYMFAASSSVTLMWALFFTSGLVFSLHVWLVPTLVVSGIAAEKRSGAMESMLITPVSPLRMAAARVLGRCWMLVLIMLSVELIRTVLSVAQDPVIPLPDWGLPTFTSAVSLASPAVVVLAHGSMACYFAARMRTMAAALSLSLLLSVTVSALGYIPLWALISWVPLNSAISDGTNDWAAWWAEISTLKLFGTALLLRVFLPAAARRLARPVE